MNYDDFFLYVFHCIFEFSLNITKLVFLIIGPMKALHLLKFSGITPMRKGKEFLFKINFPNTLKVILLFIVLCTLRPRESILNLWSITHGRVTL